MRRRLVAALGVVGLVGVSLAMMAGTASGGGPPLLTITKVIEGEAPPGAEFVVDIECTNGATATPSQVTFSGAGTEGVSIDSGNTTCTVTESETAGALEVRYGCEVTFTPDPATECSADGQSLLIVGGASQTTFTITNDFVPEPPPPPAPEPMVAEVSFTG